MPQHIARPNTKRIYEEFHGVKLPKGVVVHHILPVRLGGTHDVDNLVALTLQDHADAHMALYKEHGDPRDLCAYHMILGYEEDAHRFFSRLGGKNAQEKRIEKGLPHPFTLIPPEEQRVYASMGGKKGGTHCKELGLGIHAQTPEERLVIASRGGKMNSEKNDWAAPEKQAARGRKGGANGKGFKWYTDGVSSFKYTAAQQQEQPLEEFVEQNGYRMGKVPSYIQETCPHCGDDKILHMNRRYHFDNCKEKKD